MVTRNFKRINLLGLDFYVDWIGETGEFIAIKEVHSGRRFVFDGLKTKDGVEVAQLFRDACGIELPKVEKVKEKEPEMVVIEEKIEVAPAALETEQPKEELNGQKGKGRNRKLKK